jgi:hypothetical protein
VRAIVSLNSTGAGYSPTPPPSPHRSAAVLYLYVESFSFHVYHSIECKVEGVDDRVDRLERARAVEQRTADASILERVIKLYLKNR